jgi:acyl-CoA reductase-like NAD-dependent aldehyde dehydrogenase
MVSATPLIHDAIATANDSIYGLAASIWTKDLNTAIRAGPDLEAGVVWVNCFDHGDMTQPWGGYKQSGSGRDKCLETLTHYLRPSRSGSISAEAAHQSRLRHEFQSTVE